MENFKDIMDGFFALLILAAIGISAWFCKKRKESDR